MRRIIDTKFLEPLIILMASYVAGTPLNVADKSPLAPDDAVGVFLNADSPDPICVNQDDKNSCQGVFKCDNASLGEIECFFWVYDSECKSLRPNDPWPGIQSGDTLRFDGLEHNIQIQNVTSDLDKNKIEAEWQFVDGYFGFGHDYTRGDCSSSSVKCAFIRSSFTCK